MKEIVWERVWVRRKFREELAKELDRDERKRKIEKEFKLEEN